MSAAAGIAACIAGLAAFIGLGAFLQYRRYNGKYLAIARSVCEPGSFRTSFFLRTLLLTGRTGGRGMRYSVYGDERKGPVSSYLLLEWPVTGNFRFYRGGDVGLLAPDVRPAMAALEELPDFRALFVTSASTPYPARLITRPLGFGYKPGLLLWKWGEGGFDALSVRGDLLLLAALAESGI